VAVVAIIVALAAFAIPLISPYNASNDQVTALQSQVSQMQQQINSLPEVDETPTTRVILLDWANTGNSGQDRFNPNVITISQGDTVALTFEDNDTDGHTFEVLLPTGLVVLNNSLPGEINHLTLASFTGPATGCMLNGQSVPCNTTGTCNSAVSACNVTSHVSFTTGDLQVFLPVPSSPRHVRLPSRAPEQRICSDEFNRNRLTLPITTPFLLSPPAHFCRAFLPNSCLKKG
jgi:plastocyanin